MWMTRKPLDEHVRRTDAFRDSSELILYKPQSEAATENNMLSPLVSNLQTVKKYSLCVGGTSLQ